MASQTITCAQAGARLLLAAAVSIAVIGQPGESAASAQPIMTQTLTPEENTTDMLRNPAMGWMLYVDNTADAFERPDQYWADFGAAADQASILLIRAPWSQFEPEEGQYAWLYDDNYKQLIKGAKDRGLKLALEVFVHSQDAYRQATPDYVRTAGADGILLPYGRGIKSQIQSVTTTAGSFGGSIGDILDGNEQTAWSSALNVSYPQYITFDLGDDPAVANNLAIVAEYGAGQGITNVDVEYLSGTSWVAAAQNVAIEWGRNADTEEVRTVSFPAVSTTALRLKINEANRKYGNFSISEVYLSDNSPTDHYWTPYEDDPIFRTKFEAFLDAFAAEYDDPAVTDFVDVYGLGWWGEMHNLNLKTETEQQAASWLTDAFTERFSHVLVNSVEGGYLIDYADQTAKSGITAGIRRNSYSSPQYFPLAAQDKIRAVWRHGVPVFAENNFQVYDTWRTTWTPFYPNVGAMLRQTIMEALYTHSNVLDMRRPDDATTWVTRYPELVQHFNRYGGYRLVLQEAVLPEQIRAGEPFTLEQSWTNTAVGLFPNKRPNWDHKYKVAYALLDRTDGTTAAYTVLPDIEPGDWIRGRNYDYQSSISFNGVAAGTYDLGVAIVDSTLADQPAIRLAIEGVRMDEGWYSIGEIEVQP